MPVSPRLDYVRQYFDSLLLTYPTEEFTNTQENVFPEVVKLFYANMTVVDDDDLIIQSYILGRPIEFNIKLLCQILKLPNEADHVISQPMKIYSSLADSRKKFILLSQILDASLKLLSI